MVIVTHLGSSFHEGRLQPMTSFCVGSFTPAQRYTIYEPHIAQLQSLTERDYWLHLLLEPDV